MGEDSDLKNKLEECQKQKEEYLAGWQRARADLLNYKKEEGERVGELLKYGIEEMILKILPILDNFEMAEKSVPDKDSEDIRGLLQIKNQIIDFLKSQGVEEIKSGEGFDPQIHEVVGESDKFEEVQRGYKINGRLLRPAKVKAAK